MKAPKCIGRIEWTLPAALSVSIQKRVTKVLASYIHGEPQTTATDSRGIPFESPQPKELLTALRDLGFHGSITIKIRLLKEKK
ncbi:MAG: hypothetical protein WC763_07285 [Candidatus Paceibacterota bacterium]|jgi:hypothetical protein